jgi:hypothetical protein
VGVDPHNVSHGLFKWKNEERSAIERQALKLPPFTHQNCETPLRINIQ